MKSYIRLLYNPLLLAQGGLAAAQGALGLVQSISGQNKMNKYQSQLQPYQTPEEIYKIVEAATSRASGGLSPDTLAYMTGQVDRGFGSAINAATMLGADPNDLSRLLDQKIDATFKIGAENQMENMRNFDRYLSANQLLADNLAAEQKSKQDLVKDQLQAAQYNKASGLQNLGEAAKLGLGALANKGISDLYRLPQTTVDIPSIPKVGGSVSSVGGGLDSSTPVGTISSRSTPNTNVPAPLTTEQLNYLLSQIKKVQ